MQSQQQKTSLRILTLALNLLNSRGGYSRRQLRELVGGYADLSDITFQRTFERDLAALRESGLQVRVIEGLSEPLYSIAKGDHTGSVELTQQELSLLLQAASAWERSSPVEMSRLSLKLSSRVKGGASGSAAHIHGKLEGAEHLRILLEAMSLRQPVSFSYSSRTGTEDRDVAPLSLVVRGTAVYLWGYDFNREAERLFRLSRVRAPVTLIAEPDCYELPDAAPSEVGESPYEFEVRPLLWVKEDAAPLVRMRCRELAGSEYPSGVRQQEGWDLMRGEAGDWTYWEKLILDHASATVVVAPLPLRTRLLTLLEETAMSNLGEQRANGE